MSKTLRLNLKSQWYEMIESGEKKEEYRELKQYWATRLMKNFPVYERVLMDFAINTIHDYTPFEGREMHSEYDTVTFVYGYTKRQMTFKLEQFTVGEGRPEWGAEQGHKYFIIKIGERIS